MGPEQQPGQGAQRDAQRERRPEGQQQRGPQPQRQDQGPRGDQQPAASQGQPTPVLVPPPGVMSEGTAAAQLGGDQTAAPRPDRPERTEGERGGRRSRRGGRRRRREPGEMGAAAGAGGNEGREVSGDEAASESSSFDFERPQGALPPLPPAQSAPPSASVRPPSGPVSAPPAPAPAGDELVAARFSARRMPALRPSVPRERVRLAHAGRTELVALRSQLDLFRAELARLGPRSAGHPPLPKRQEFRHG